MLKYDLGEELHLRKKVKYPNTIAADLRHRVLASILTYFSTMTASRTFKFLSDLAQTICSKIGQT